MNWLFDDRWQGSHGIARYGREVLRELRRRGIQPETISGAAPLHPKSLLRDTLRKPARYSPGFNGNLYRGCSTTILTVHDLMHLEFKDYATRARTIYYQRVVKPTIQYAPLTFTVSEFSKQRLMQWGCLTSDRIITTGCGVSSQFTPDGAFVDFTAPYYLYIGNHKPHKNLPRLIRAFASASLSSNAKLCISGQPSRGMQKLIEQSPKRNAVEFLGAIPEIDLPALYRGAQGLLMPSLYEGFGLPALEAMACGTPVLYPNQGALTELANRDDIVVDAYSIQAIRQGIEALDHDDNRRRMLGQRASQRARPHTWAKVTDRIAEALEGVGWISPR